MSLHLRENSEVKGIIENVGEELRAKCYKQKQADACHLLADFFERMQEDFSKAGKIYKSNCDDYHYGKSCFKFAQYKLMGKGNQLIDTEIAFEYYRKGCELGVSESCLNAGLMCIGKGSHSRKVKDLKKGLQLLHNGCESRNSFCCYFLGALYLTGVPVSNLKKDLEKAKQYLEMGCDIGNSFACNILSQMYTKGDGVPLDELKAEKYRIRAKELKKLFFLK